MIFFSFFFHQSTVLSSHNVLRDLHTEGETILVEFLIQFRQLDSSFHGDRSFFLIDLSTEQKRQEF